MRRVLRIPFAGIVLAIVGIALMGLGVYRGEMAVVLEKAVNICMECVGIG
ncbi:MAG: thioredoxin [Lachnospiraceae bacterium]